MNERGLISASTDAASSAVGSFTIRKPPGATVRAAYLAVASTGFRSTPLSQPIILNGVGVPLDRQVASGIASFNYLMDVTTVVRPSINAAVPGNVTIPVSEPQSSNTDGSILTVIYDDPAVRGVQTVSLLYGALSTSGDHYTVHLERPIQTSDSALALRMGLGISYSFQSNGTQQYSQVNVNGKRLTTSAGGEDDGAPADGELITVGGEGDSLANPSNPNATPANPRSDDELYDLRPFVANGATSISIESVNPSADDNIFLAVFTMNPPVSSIDTGNSDEVGTSRLVTPTLPARVWSPSSPTRTMRSIGATDR